MKQPDIAVFSNWPAEALKAELSKHKLVRLVQGISQPEWMIDIRFASMKIHQKRIYSNTWLKEEKQEDLLYQRIRECLPTSFDKLILTISRDLGKLDLTGAIQFIYGNQQRRRLAKLDNPFFWDWGLIFGKALQWKLTQKLKAKKWQRKQLPILTN